MAPQLTGLGLCWKNLGIRGALHGAEARRAERCRRPSTGDTIGVTLRISIALALEGLPGMVGFRDEMLCKLRDPRAPAPWLDGNRRPCGASQFPRRSRAEWDLSATVA